MPSLLLHDGWELTHSDPDVFASGKMPVASDWRPAPVPGNVQTSPFGLPTAELYRRDNVRAVQWMEARAAEKAVNAGAPFAHREWLAGATARYEEPAHVLLGGVTAECAPGCLYQNTSAMEGEGEVHGIWTWNPRIGDHRYRMFATPRAYWRAADQHLYSEAGVACVANIETIRDVLGDACSDALPSPDDPLWRLHHGFGAAWDGLRDNWLDVPSTEELFGPIASLRELVALNQYLQAEGGRFMIEELRRKQPRATGVIWWGANEPWPGLAGNALIDWHGRSKPAWAAVANAFAPTILSLRYDDLRPRALRADLWLSCNALGGFAGHYEAAVADGKGAIQDRFTGPCDARYGESFPLLRLPRTPLARGDWLEVRTRLSDRAGAAVHENRYWFGRFRDKVLRIDAGSSGQVAHHTGAQQGKE